MSIVAELFNSVAVGASLGAVGIFIGQKFDNLALRRGWRGWHTDKETNV